MVRYLSRKMTNYIVSKSDTADYDVIFYGYELLFQELLVILIALLLALVFDILGLVVIAIISHDILRNFAGGPHAKYRAICIMMSIIIIFGPALIVSLTGQTLGAISLLTIGIVDIGFLSKYAPADTAEKPISSRENRVRLRRYSIIIMAIYVLLGELLLNIAPSISTVLIMTPSFVCLFSHPIAYRLLGCAKYITKES